MNKQYKLNKGFISQKIGNKTTIFSGEDSTLYTLNEVAGFILESVKLGMGKESIALRLTEKYEIDQEKALKDVDDFFEILVKKKIIIKK